MKVWNKKTLNQEGRQTVYKRSGLNLLASDAQFSNPEQQIQDALIFLKRYEVELTRLTASPGVEDIVLDFGIEDRGVVAQADYFLPELLRSLGERGIGLVLSRYPRAESGVNSS